MTDRSAFRSDVCIVGSGPAGIVAALELSKRGVRVLLIEAGATAPTRTSQPTGRVLTPSRHPPIGETTSKNLGGTSSLWAGRCVPLTPLDLENRDYIALSGWPIDYEELARHYPLATTYCDAGDNRYTVNPIDWSSTNAGRNKREETDLCGAVSSTSIERWSSPIRFGVAYRQSLQNDDNIQVLVNTTCTNLNLDADNRTICGIDLVTSSLKKATATATEYILACGGIETARLLLASNRQERQGIGNANDLVGRYYMGHIFGSVATVQLSPHLLDEFLGFKRDADGVFYRRRLCITPQAQRQERLLNAVFYPDAPKAANPDHASGMLSAGYLLLNLPYLGAKIVPPALKKAFLGNEKSSSTVKHVINIVRDAPHLTLDAPRVISRLFFSDRKLPAVVPALRGNTYDLHYHAEQEPDRNNRVSLIDKPDRYGMPEIAVTVNYSTTDIDSIFKSHEILKSSIETCASGCKIMYKSDNPRADIIDQACDGYHQIGMTRMANDEKRGVVDTNCKVHGVDNLYISSSSVFPTSGHANPTLTIVALSARLAERIAKLRKAAH